MSQYQQGEWTCNDLGRAEKTSEPGQTLKLMMMIFEYHKRQGLLDHLSDYQFLKQELCSIRVVTLRPHKELPRINALTWAVASPPPLSFPIFPSGCLIFLFTKTVVIIIFPSVMRFALVDPGRKQLEGNGTVGTEWEALSSTTPTIHRTSLRGLGVAGYLFTLNSLYMIHNIAAYVKIRVRFPAGERDFLFSTASTQALGIT
jgi:hypothetical protein